MRPYGSPKQLEKRRRHAIQLVKKGKMSLSAIARMLGSSKSSVSRWWKTYRKKGGEGLKPKPAPGRPCRLTKKQKRVLVSLLLKGPVECGFPNNLWTLKRIAKLIYQHFRIRYHPNHVWRLLINLRWSCQKPERRAIQRDEEKIKYWKQHTWPNIKKTQKTQSISGVYRRKRIPAYRKP